MAFEKIDLDTTKAALSTALTDNDNLKAKFGLVDLAITNAFGKEGNALASTLGSYSLKYFEGGTESFYNLMQSKITYFLEYQVPSIINAQSEVANTVYTGAPSQDEGGNGPTAVV